MEHRRRETQVKRRIHPVRKIHNHPQHEGYLHTLNFLALNPRSKEYVGQTNIARQEVGINIRATKFAHIRS